MTARSGYQTHENKNLMCVAVIGLLLFKYSCILGVIQSNKITPHLHSLLYMSFFIWLSVESLIWIKSINRFKINTIPYLDMALFRGFRDCKSELFRYRPIFPGLGWRGIHAVTRPVKCTQGKEEDQSVERNMHDVGSSPLHTHSQQ